MLSRTIHVTPLSAPTVTAPAASAPMAGHLRSRAARDSTRRWEVPSRIYACLVPVKDCRLAQSLILFR